MKTQSIIWKKLPSDPLTHDQWDAVNRDALIRGIGDSSWPMFELYVRTKYIGSYRSLRTAKDEAENFC